MIAQSYYDTETETWRFRTLAGAAGSGLPIGAIVAVHGNAIPAGYLECNGAEFDILKYPALYTLLQDNHTPDLRECNLVGIGLSSRESITSHDVYDLGQFKDDQIQQLNVDIDLGTVDVKITDPGHTHTAVTTNGAQEAKFGQVTGTTSFLGGGGVEQTGELPVVESTTTIEESKTGITAELESQDATVGLSGYRYGATTHGKNYGVRYIIKANTGSNEIDDDKVYGELVAFLEDNYSKTDKSNLQDKDILMYDQSTDQIVAIPRATINGQVLTIVMQDAYDEDVLHHVYMDNSGNLFTEDWDTADEPAGTETDRDLVGYLYVKDEVRYSRNEGVWYTVTRLQDDTFVFDEEVTDADLIVDLDGLELAEIRTTIYYLTYTETISHDATYEYEWKSKGNAAVFYFETEEEFEAAKTIEEGQEGYLSDNCIVVLKYKKDVFRGEDA